LRLHTPRLDAQLYRGVIHREKPLHVKLLGYPPPELVTNFQRCNPPNHPMFYCTPDPVAAIFELRVQPGDKVYLSKWSIIEEFFYVQISLDEGETQTSNEAELIFSYFETKFLQPIHETYSNQYKITSAISENLTIADMVGDKRTNGGLTYPSVAHPNRSDNFSVQPHVVDRCLQLKCVEELSIEAVNGTEILYNRTDFSSSFEDGCIIWSGKSIHWNLKQGDLVTMTKEPFGWVARYKDGTIMEPG
jgi:hypothetical protein